MMTEPEYEVSKEVIESANKSLIYAKIITIDLCREPEEDPEPPACVPPPTAETRMCDPQGATAQCVTQEIFTAAFMLVQEAKTDDSKKDQACG